MEPQEGYLGDEFAFSLQYWDFEGPTIEWRVWSSIDGNPDQLMTTDWVGQNDVYSIIPINIDPLIFEIRDMQGEVST